VISTSSKVQYVQGANFDEVTDIDEAVSAAQQSDVVILCVGEAPESETPGDINDLTLSSPQIELMNALATTKTPIILVLVEARPRILTSAVTAVDAILMAYLPSSEGGQAIAEIIFGVVNPSGKLPLTYPQYTGDIGVSYYKKYTDTTSPLFTFGDGLSYTTFEYSNMTASSSTIQVGDKLEVSVTVTNTGSVGGKETVLLYLSDVYASITPEVKMLKYFDKQYFASQESKIMSFTLQPEDFSFIGRNNKPVIEPGEFIISAGNQQVSIMMEGKTTEWTALATEKVILQ